MPGRIDLPLRDYTVLDANDCNEYERSCLADGKCIPETWWCDAHSIGPDCSDGADETKCSGKVQEYYSFVHLILLLL